MMNGRKIPPVRSASLVTLALAGLFAAISTATAQNVQHLSITQRGGMPGMPVMTGIEKTTNGVIVTWDGPSGYYQLVKKSGLLDMPWQPVGGANLSRKATITGIYSNTFFRVSGPAPHYAGSQACTECHENIHTTEMDTRHAGALETLKAVHQDKNPSCLPCHTVGYGLPTGFVSEAATPQLAGVQCENCHGPAANHAANEYDITVRPRVEIAATVCGGCHTEAHHPTFDEWETSGHAEVVEDMNAANRIESCGRCHSGSSRLAQLNGLTGGSLTNAVQGDANIGLVCVTCHDPHGTHVFTNFVTGVVYTNQLRNPISSTNDYFVTTSGALTNQYNPNINVCAQCHNHRGADWTSSSRPPHHSPQYNMLLATVGVLPSGVAKPAAHAGTRFITNSFNQAVLVTNQCVTCHMQKEEFVSEFYPAYTGHSFRVESFDACRDCHSVPELLTEFVTGSVSNQIQQVKTYLDFWATTKAPDALRTKYGPLAWEYSTPGELSSGSGPNSGEQAQIPANIKKARFNLYIVLNDGSYGVHNGPYSVQLLNAARDWVQQELDK